MSEYCGQKVGRGGLDKRCDTKVTETDSLETDTVPLDESISSSQEMHCQIQPLIDKTNQPDHESEQTYGENSLCHGVNKMHISPNSNGADGKHLAQSEGQNYVSGTNAPDLLQNFMREGEHHGQDVNSRHATAGGAAGGSGNASEVQTPQQSQQDQVPYTAIQEATSQPLPKPTSPEAPEEDDEHYDVLVLYSEHDQSEAQQFFDIAEKANWKVATSDDFLPTRTKFRSFEAVYKNSSYTILLLTPNFLTDIWCEHRYQSALVQSIQNPAKKETVIAVICQDKDFPMPMELPVFTSVKLNNPRIQRNLQKCISKEKRLQREQEALNHMATPK